MNEPTKPGLCPFNCGGDHLDPEVRRVGGIFDDDGWTVHCQRCLCSGPVAATVQDAIAAWNRSQSHHEVPPLHEARPGYVLCCCGDHVVPLAEDGDTTHRTAREFTSELPQPNCPHEYKTGLEESALGTYFVKRCCRCEGVLEMWLYRRAACLWQPYATTDHHESEYDRMRRLHPVRMRWEAFKLTLSEWWHA